MFRPYGLDVPDRLAAVLDSVADSLKQDREANQQRRTDLFRNPPWKTETAVAKALRALRHNSGIEQIKQLATLTDDETKRLEQLRVDLADEPERAAEAVRLQASRLRKLATILRDARAAMSDESLEAIASRIRDAKARRSAATLAANHAFGSEPVDGVGSDAWRQLWEAARRFSEGSAYPGESYPVVDKRCVLCQQPLVTEAQNRLQMFEEFIKNETEMLAKEAEVDAEEQWKQLVDVATGTQTCRDLLGELTSFDEDLSTDCKRCLVIARIRRRHALRNADGGFRIEVLPVLPDVVVRLDALISRLDGRASELSAAAKTEARKALEKECDELEDREKLGARLTDVAAELDRLKEHHALSSGIGEAGTRCVTDLGNELAKDVLTNQLRDRFANELILLAEDRVRAELQYAGGRRGVPRYQVKLIARPDAAVGQILSEGEQTCVAIAAFLTELATAEHQSSIIFDDPVCSLDHKWRLRVAKRLVAEAERRPVVVFTHDIVFVHDLHDQAAEKEIPCELRSVRRRGGATGIAEDGLPWKGQRIQQRLDQLGKRVGDAKLLYDMRDDDAYNVDVRSIYDDLRSTWERALEEVAFQRIVVRHRDYINTTNLKKVSVLTAADCETFRKHFSHCSDVVRSHDPSAGRNSEVPTPAEMQSEVQALDDWVRDLKGRQKMVS